MGFEVFRRTKAEDGLRRQNAGLDLLAEGAKQLLSSDKPEHIIQALCERVMGHLDCQVFSSFLSLPDQPGMHLIAHAGMDEQTFQSIGCPFPNVVAWECHHRPGCQRASICCTGNSATESNPLASYGIQAYACHPLVDQDRNIGILSFGTRTRIRFSEDDLDLMRAVADLVAAALARWQEKKKLEASEERLKLALAGAGAGCYEWEPATGKNVWTDELWALYGLGHRSISPSYDAWRQTVCPDDLERVEEAVREAVAQGAEFEVEWQVNVPAGCAPRWLMSRARPVLTADGGVERYIGIAIDISKRKQMEQALRENKARLRLALEGANAGVWDRNLATGELMWSAQQAELYGIAPDSLPLTFADWERAVLPADLPAAKAKIQEILASQENTYRDEFRIEHPQRGTRWILRLGHIVRAGDHTPLRMYGIDVDITEHKEWEHELECRVAERTAELRAANKELEGFTYAASHDMRAPLGRINSFSTLLVRHYQDRLEGDGLLFLDLIQQNALRLNRLVEDLLAHVQLGQQPMQIQAVESYATVRNVLHERADHIRQCGADIRLDFPDSIVIQGNPLGLSQVLHNLVDNALKYSDQGKPTIIEIGGRRQEGLCRLWVRDNGIGLDMTYKDRIFELFRRLHTYSEYPGSGIGLALVKKAMERMGGRVWVESEVGHGSTFFLELPADGDDIKSASQ